MQVKQSFQSTWLYAGTPSLNVNEHHVGNSMHNLNSNSKAYAEWFENRACVGQSAGKTSKYFIYEVSSETTRQAPSF